jgi:hypothetical protein
MAKTVELKPPEPVRFWVLATLFALALIMIPVPGWVVEELYSRDTYPWLQDVLTAGTNVLPFALLDVLLIGGGLAVLFRIVRLVNVVGQRGFVDAVWEGVRRVIRAAAVLVILFYWGWGFNYRRPSIEAALPGAATVRPTEDLLQLAIVDANSLATRLRPVVVTQREVTYDDLTGALLPQLNDALKRVGRPPLQRGGQPKYSFVLRPFFTSAGITGMINPLGLESIVHPDLLPYERPFVLAHEWAHLSGQADEAEASAIGWYACMLGDVPFAYSASLYLIMEASAKLSPAAHRTAWARLDTGVRTDIEAIAARMRRQDPVVQRTTSQVYDGFLRVNRVADGTDSYSRAVAFILTPPLRDALSTYDAIRK